MNEIQRLQQLAGLAITEAEDKMPSRSEVMKCCKDGMSASEICKKYPDCDQDKLKELCKDCKDALAQKEKIEMSEAETGDEVTKTVAGHTDDEKDMIMKQLYQTGKYCVELYKMIGKMDENTDFPHWWQGKVVKASDYIGAAKHYLENEIESPDVEVTVTPDIEDNDPSGVS